MKRKQKFGTSYIDIVLEDKYAVEFIIETNRGKKEKDVFMKGQKNNKGKYFKVVKALQNSNDKLQKMGSAFQPMNKWSVVIVKTGKQAKKVQEAVKEITENEDVINRGGSCWYAYSNAGYLAVLHRPKNNFSSPKPKKKKKTSANQNSGNKPKNKKKKKKSGSSPPKDCDRSATEILSVLGKHTKEASKYKTPQECTNSKNEFGGTRTTTTEIDFLNIMKSEAVGFKNILKQNYDKTTFLEHARILMSKGVQCHTKNFSYNEPIKEKKVHAFLESKNAILLMTASSGTTFKSGLRDLEEKLSKVYPKKDKGVVRWIVTIMELNDVNCGSITDVADKGYEKCNKEWNSSPQYVGSTGQGVGGSLVRPKLFFGAENWVVADKEAGVLISLVCLKKRGDPSSCNLPGQKKRKSVKSDASYTQEDLDTIVTELSEKPEPNKLVLVKAVSKVLSLKPKETKAFFDAEAQERATADFINSLFNGSPNNIDFGWDGMTEEEQMLDFVDRMLGEGAYEGLVEKPFKPGAMDYAEDALKFGWKLMQKMGKKAKKKVFRIKDTPEEIEKKKKEKEAKKGEKSWFRKKAEKLYEKGKEKAYEGAIKGAVNSPKAAEKLGDLGGGSDNRDADPVSSEDLLKSVYQGFESAAEGIAYIAENLIENLF